METIARKPIEHEYEERRLTVEQYAELKRIGKSTARRYLKLGLIKEQVEQLAPHYPIAIIVKIRKHST